jgi:DNA-binding MarR family transcriptional regulator
MGPNDTAFQVISFSASIASLIVGVGAIALSVVFFQLSSKAVNATTEAARDIGSSVARLEKLFDRMYSDTFAMMREAVSEIQKHAWPSVGPEPPDEAAAVAEEADTKAEEKASELTESLVKQILSRQQGAQTDVHRLRHEMQVLVDRAINESRQIDVEAREETTREHILRYIRTKRLNGGIVTAGDIAERLNLTPTQLKTELDNLTEEGIIRLFPASDFSPRTRIRMATRVRTRPSTFEDKSTPNATSEATPPSGNSPANA